MSSRIWKASPIRSPNAPSVSGSPSPSSAPSSAGRAEQNRGLQPAPGEIALDAHIALERVLALRQLSEGELATGSGEDPDRLGGTAAGELGERAREQQIAGGDREPAPAGRDHGRTAAAERGAVEHIVVDERRPVHELDRDRRANEAVGLGGRRAGGQAYEQRAQPLAAGGDRVARVACEHGPVTGGELRHPPLDAVHDPRELLTPGIDDGLCARAHQVGTVPTCRAMIPPAVRTYRMFRSPARHIPAASSSGPGKRLTEFGR